MQPPQLVAHLWITAAVLMYLRLRYQLQDLLQLLHTFYNCLEVRLEIAQRSVVLQEAVWNT